MLQKSRVHLRTIRIEILLCALIIVGAGGTLGAAAAQDASPVATPSASEPWWQDAVCYEIFVRSFADSDGDGTGDLAGLTSRLDYLNDGDPATTRDLGVNCIYLMPIAEATSYHGYDTIDFMTVEQDYGSNDDFHQFIAATNARGIRVITDLVINHVSVEHSWFQEALADPRSPYRDYFVFSPSDPGYGGSFGQEVWFPTPAGDAYYYATFGEGLPDLNYRNPAVTNATQEIARFWLEEMGVAGFRLDAIKHLIENGREQENTTATHAWLQEFGAFLATVKPDTYSIGEIFGASAFMLSAYFPDQLTAYFQFELGAQVLQASQFGAGASLAHALDDALEQLPDQRFAPFLTNHDQTRTMSILGGDLRQAKLAATALMTLPGLPFVYYGEEIGMTGNKPDPRLRTPMQWTADASGFTGGIPWEPFQDDLAVINVATQDDDPNSLLQHYRTMINLHISSPALSHGAAFVLDAPTPLVAFLRVAEEQTVLVVINFGDQPIFNPELAIDTSGLRSGNYALQPILGDANGTTFEVTDGGEIESYTGLARLAPETGYVFELAPRSP